MQDAISFAKLHNKPLSLSETGAGNSSSSPASYGPIDDPDFPKWLSGALSAAKASGVTIQNVNIWDVGSFSFNTSRPLEAAAWAKYFGAGSVPSGGSPPPIVTIGSGPDTLALRVSEDAWNGNAQFTVSVDGRQIGGTLTATASHAAGQTQIFNVLGTFAAGSHTAAVNFLNDAYGGSPATDRNLYVTGATIDNSVVSGATLSELVSGPQHFTFIAPGSSGSFPPVTVGSGSDTLALRVSEDAWNGNAQFVVSVDGKLIGGTLTAMASHAAGQTQIFNVLGTFAAGSHTAAVNFLNDAYGGSPATDRNLYVTGATIDNSVVSGATLSEVVSGPTTFHLPSAGLALDHFRRSRSAAGPIPWRCRFPRMRGTATPSSSSRSMAS